PDHAVIGYSSPVCHPATTTRHPEARAKRASKGGNTGTRSHPSRPAQAARAPQMASFVNAVPIDDGARMTRPNQLDFATRCVHAGQEPDPTTGAVMMPIYTTSTYAQSSPGVHKGFDYARTKNPTRMAFERCIADLEGGSAGFAFASGLAAIATVLDCLDHGAHIIAVDDLYGGSRRLFERVRKRSAGLETTYLDPTDLGALEGAIRPNTRLIWIETPTNPLLKL